MLRGFTYAFNVNASGHPFWIQTVSGAYSSGNIYNSGVTNNGVQVGTLTFAIPYDAPSTLYYVCQNHSLMQGVINISDVGPQGPQGAAAVVGGSNTHIQFNDSTSLNGSAGFTFNKTSNNVTIANNISATTGTFAGAVSGITTLAAGNTTITGDVTVSGNLTISGTTTNINSTNLLVEDKNIILGDVTTPSDVTADGGGITLKGGTDKTFNWVDATDSWTASEHIDLAAGKAYKIGTTTIANSTSLGTGILASSLTSVGTLSSLTLGGAVSGITTLAAGNTTITGFANVSTTLQVGTNTATFGTAVYIIANGNFGIANSTPEQKLTVAGIIESTTGGIKFPDGTTQTSAGINIGKSIAMAMIFGG